MSQNSIPTAEQYALFKSTNFCEVDTNGSYTPTNNLGHLPTSYIGTGAIMISSTFILAFLASKAFVEAAPAKTNTISYPEVITIHPPKIMTTKTTKTMTWPDGFLNLPGRTSTITKTISLLPLHARETGGVSLERTETTAVLFGEALSALPMPTEDIRPSPVFISHQASLSVDVDPTATHSGESAVGAKNVIEARGPQPEKTVFITITKEPTRSTVTPKSATSTWSKGKHCPYPYPGEKCQSAKSEHKTTRSSSSTKSSSSIPPKTSLSNKTCPYPGQKC